MTETNLLPARRCRRWQLLVAALVSLFVGGSITSCVYFNTYYNAEKYFREAEAARAEAEAAAESGRRNSTQYVTLYDKAVRRASVVLEKFPDSELVDDAMFIAGRALYWQRDYQYAMRSFRDLELNFPASEYFDRARLWRGRTLMALGQLPEARALFSELLREGSAVGDRAGLRQGELVASEGDRRGAIAEYRRALEAFPESPLASQMWLRIGEANIDIGGPARLDSAMSAFERSVNASPPDSVRYRASLNRGRVQYLQGQSEEALGTYQGLLAQGRFRAWEGETRILIGRYFRELGLLTEALAQFERVRDDFPSTAVSAMALYETGLLFLQEHGQPDRAQEYLAEVTAEKRGSRADSLANVMLNTYAELDGLLIQVWIADSTAASILFPETLVVSATDTVAHTPASEVDSTDSTVADADTMVIAEEGLLQTAGVADALAAETMADRVLNLPHNLQAYVIGVDSSGSWQALIPRPSSRDGEQAKDQDQKRRRRPPKRPTESTTLEEHLFAVAELYRDRLELPDSSAAVYQAVVEHFPESVQRSRALYSLAWIYFEQLGQPTAAQPYLQQLVTEYGATEHANAARRLLELPLERTAESQAAEVYAQIEELQQLQPDSYDAWLPQLDALSRDYPSTITAAQAAFLAAWTTENIVGDSTAAEIRYDSLAARFQHTRFADLVTQRRKSQQDGLLAKMEKELKTLGQAIVPAERLLLIAVEPDSLDTTSLSQKYLGFAMRAHRHEQFEQAEQLYQASLDQKEGRNGNAHAGLGDVAWRQGYFEDAIDRLRTAMEEKATSLLPRYRLFQYFVQQAQADSANHYLRQLARRDRDNPDVLSVIDRFPTVASAEPEDIEFDMMETITLEPADDNLRERPASLGIAELPLVRSSPGVRYPEGATDSATVIVDILVTREGRPDSLRVFQGSEPFATAALNAVGAYRFYPGENRKEEPLNIWVEVIIPFEPPLRTAADSVTVDFAITDSVTIASGVIDTALSPAAEVSNQ